MARRTTGAESAGLEKPTANGSFWKLVCTALMAGAVASSGVFLTTAAGRVTRPDVEEMIKDHDDKPLHTGAVSRFEWDQLLSRVAATERNTLWLSMRLAGGVPPDDWQPPR